MPPLVIAAGIGAVASVGGAVISGNANTRASNAQVQAADRQTQNANQNRDYQYNLNAPAINQGQRAGDVYAGLLGVGGDPKASADALETFRGSTGYTDLQREGSRSTNAAVFAGGLGQSGAALKALQDRGTQIANSSQGDYRNSLLNLIGGGAQARGLVAGVGQNTVNTVNQATQNSADARGNAALAGAANTNGLIQNLLNAGVAAYGSSYKKPVPASSQSPSYNAPRGSPFFSPPYNPGY